MVKPEIEQGTPIPDIAKGGSPIGSNFDIMAALTESSGKVRILPGDHLMFPYSEPMTVNLGDLPGQIECTEFAGRAIERHHESVG